MLPEVSRHSRADGRAYSGAVQDGAAAQASSVQCLIATREPAGAEAGPFQLTVTSGVEVPSTFTPDRADGRRSSRHHRLTGGRARPPYSPVNRATSRASIVRQR